jgi:hypothetical protein
MGRKNADSLVGLPTLIQRNYNAAETKGIDMKTLRFRKRPNLGHYSLYVKGFKLDTITEIYPSSQGGLIPLEWAKAAGWHKAPKTPPPDAFWRTLVADRGRDGRNPPVYYSRACQESFLKGGLMSESVDTTDLINSECSTAVPQFCRRVQAVIWNRALVKTERGTLGLVGKNVEEGDLVCILYGCSVPVILRRTWKKKSIEDINEEIAEDIREWLKVFRTKSKLYRKRVEMFREKRRDEKWKYREWENQKKVQWQRDKAWRNKWEENQCEIWFWKASEEKWAREHPPASNEAKKNEQVRAMDESDERTNKPPRLEVRNDDEWWDTWEAKRKVETGASKQKLKQFKSAGDLIFYHQLQELNFVKPPWEADKEWWKSWCRWMTRKNASLKDVDGWPVSDNRSADKMKWTFYFWNLEMGKSTLLEDFEFNQWKAEHRPLRNASKEEKKAWNEPSPNWSEFELFLRYGRRWKRHWEAWKKKTRKSRKAEPNQPGVDPANEHVSKPDHDIDPQTRSLSRSPSCQSTPNRLFPSGNSSEESDIETHGSTPSETHRGIWPALEADLEAEMKREKEIEAEEERKKDEDELMAWLREARKDYHSPWHYEFFGECYIHGMMDGEAMASQNNEGIPAEVFELR